MVAIVGGHAVALRLDHITTDGICKGIAEAHALSERKSYPVDSITDGDGMFGWVERRAFQRNLSIGTDPDSVHLRHIQGGQLSSPSDTIVGGIVVVF